MRRDVQLYIQRDKQVVGSIGEENLVTDGNFVNGTTNWDERAGVSYTDGSAIVNSSSVTNLQIRSEEFDNVTWGKVNSSITANNTIAPDGTNTADKLTATASSLSTYVYEQHNLSASTDYTMSVFVKKGTSNLVRLDLEDFTSGTQGRMTFNLNTREITQAVGTASYEDYGNGWYRLNVSFTTSATLGIHYLRIWDFETVNNADFYLWGAMINEGGLSDYIKTEGTTASANANDTLKQPMTYTDGQKYRVSADIWCPPDEVNQFLWSDDLSQSVWAKVGVIQAVQKFKQDSTTGSKYIRQDTSVTSGQDYTVSFYVKYNGQKYVQITGSTGFNSYYVNFDLINGTITRNLNNITATIEPKEDGYYRISYTDAATSTSSSGRFILALIPSATSSRVASIAGDNSSGIFFKHAMMDKSSELRDYVATTNSAVSNTGFAGNSVKIQDNDFNLGGLLEADTSSVLSSGFNRLTFDFTANSESNTILISGDTDSASYTFNVSNVELREVTDPYVTYENVKLDLFDFEDINITDKIKDIRDVSKVFTGFSQQFTVPASKTNNNLFSHFYNADVVSGFDQRIKHKAFIKIGGADYKEGRISLTGSSMQNGRPYSYSVVFYGKTVELKDLIGDDELRDLAGTLLDNFSFEYSDSLVLNGFMSGFDFQEYNQTLNTTTPNSDGNPDLFFPMISADSYYFYDSNNGSNPKDRVDSRNIYASATTSPKGVYFKDLKPAIKVKFLIRAIEEKYGITFSDDFFNENNEQYEKLSMLLHREKGNIGNQLEEQSKIINLSDLDITNNYEYRGDYTLSTNSILNEVDYPMDLDTLMWTRNTVGVFLDYVLTHQISFDVEVVGSGEYTIEVFDANNANSNAFSSLVNTTGNYSGFVWDAPAHKPAIEGNSYSSNIKFGFNKPKIKISTQGGISSFKVTNIKLKRVDKIYYVGTSNLTSTNFLPTEALEFNGNALYSYSSNGVDGVQLISQMPKIKVLDFLTGLFKMFNLTAYYVQDDGLSEYNGQIRVRSVDSFYFDGKEHDISKYVSTDSIEINRNNLYSSIEFKFEPHKTFAAIQALELTGDEFGYELLNNLNSNIQNPLAFDGGKYNVKLPFEKMMYERMNDQAQENFILPIQWGWTANREENPILGKPILFYGVSTDTSTSVDYNGNDADILFDGSIYDKDGNIVTSNHTVIDKFIRPSNSVGANRKSINFGSEYDEFYIWDGEGSNENSLFNLYYRRYLLQIYDRQSRIVKAKAHLPINIVTKLNMNDVVIINGRRYRLNSLQANLSTGKADLELMNDIAYSTFNINKPSINVVQDNSTSLFIFKGGIDEGYMESLSWNIYVNGVYHQNYSYAAQMTLSSSDFGAGNHNVYITAVLDGKESQPSDVYEFTLS